MTKNEQIILNVRNILRNLNEKLFVGFFVIDKYGNKRSNVRIVNYNEDDNVCRFMFGQDQRKVQYGLPQFLSGDFANTYEIKVKKSAIMFRWMNNGEMTNWRVLTFSVIK